MDEKYQNYKEEIEKINQRVKEYLWKEWYSFEVRKAQSSNTQS